MPYEGEQDEKYQNYSEPSAEDTDCWQSYSNNGICPCCGAHTRTCGGNYQGGWQQECCEECEWAGEIEHD